MFHFLRVVLFVPPMGQWSWLCQTKAETKLPSFLGMFPGGHPWHVILKNIRWWISWMLPTSSITEYPWYTGIDDILMFRWWILIRSGEKLQKSTYLDSEIFGCQRSSMDLQDIHCQGRKAPARGKPRLHRPLATETCLELGETRFQPALSTWICLETTVKTCKNPNLMVNNVYFPHTSLFWRYLLSPYTAEWLMIYELLHNVSHVSWGFFDLDVFLVKPWNH